MPQVVCHLPSGSSCSRSVARALLLNVLSTLPYPVGAKGELFMPTVVMQMLDGNTLSRPTFTVQVGV